MPEVHDGPVSSRFVPIALTGNTPFADMASAGLSREAAANVGYAPSGYCVCWGIPFRVGDPLLVREREVSVSLSWAPVAAPWLVFMHATDVVGDQPNAQGFYEAPRGPGRLGERVADYVFRYSDGHEERVSLRRRHQLGMLRRDWGQNCFEAVAHQKPFAMPALSDQPRVEAMWGWAQCRAVQPDAPPWVNWLWGWENPRPEVPVTGLRVEPVSGALIISAITSGSAGSNPLRWESRRKAVLRLPEGEAFDPAHSQEGLLRQVKLDLGQVISAQARLQYPTDGWEASYNNQNPAVPGGEVIVEYTAHPDACFHLGDGSTLPLAEIAPEAPVRPVARAARRVKLRVIDARTREPVAVKLHAHGEAGEYLQPVDRNRLPDPHWYEDWSCDYLSPPHHWCTYIPGETIVDLPVGRVYVELSKGFEIRPIRRTVEVTGATSELTFEIERVLPWRERGWVTADTHVHFLSPATAHLEGAGEGVNVVNLLASQWGELMTNVGDFTGITYGARAGGGDGEYLVRVGTENRQHVLGHISLLGYGAPIIAPMCSGGPDESALGDPLDVLLTEWARQCRAQGGIVVLPHFPRPRAEHATAIVSGDIDAVEMTSWGNLYGGIDPYSLSDWYRYLNCGYFVAAVGGTDKMSANTAVGAVRTYAKLRDGAELDYEAWKDAVRRGQTFATYGPLMEFSVEGKPAGSRMELGAPGGSLTVEWEAASVTVPMSRVDLVVSGVIRESVSVDPWSAKGSWTVPVDKSCWVALLIRGHYADRPEIIAAHSSPVVVSVAGSQFAAAADAMTILEQIEGALVYLDTIGTRAETEVYQRMRLVLTSAYRDVHNRLHQGGWFHEHTPVTDHPDHRT